MSHRSAEFGLEWTKDNTLQLIKLLKQNQLLWHPQHKDFGKKRLRANTLECMAEELTKTTGKNITKDAIVKKMHTLRSQFNREMKIIKFFKETAVGLDEENLPTLWCFEDLLFLDTDNQMGKPNAAVMYEDTEAEDPLEDPLKLEPPTQVINFIY